MEEYSSGSAYNVVPALILRWPTFELILKNRIEWIFDVLCIFLPGSKYCSKEALEKLPIDSDISLVSEKLHLVLSRTKLSKSTLSWSMHFTQELRSSVAERAESTPKGKHTCWRIRIHSIYVSDCSFMCLSSKWGFSVTVLMSTAALVPPAPRCFECFPLGKKKPGREPFLLGDSLILRSLCEWGTVTVCQFLFCVQLHLKSEDLGRGFMMTNPNSKNMMGAKMEERILYSSWHYTN